MKSNSYLSQLPTLNREGAIFMGSQRQTNDCSIALLGVPFDGTTSFKPGARFGPSSIREVSNSLETFCPQLNLDLEDFKYVDLGSLEINIGDPKLIIEDVSKATKTLIKNELKPLILGGEHSITSGSVNAAAQCYPDLILIQLDAHADLREEWLGTKESHACTMRRCLQVLPSKTLFQIGIRSGSKEEFEFMRENNTLINYTSVAKNENLKKSLEPYKGTPIYLTIDVDWFDPSVMPGTGTPEPGGYFWQDLAAIFNILKEHNIIAADIVELAPMLDNSGISSVLAAKVTRSLLMLLNQKFKN